MKNIIIGIVMFLLGFITSTIIVINTLKIEMIESDLKRTNGLVTINILGKDYYYFYEE